MTIWKLLAQVQRSAQNRRGRFFPKEWVSLINAACCLLLTIEVKSHFDTGGKSPCQRNGISKKKKISNQNKRDSKWKNMTLDSNKIWRVFAWKSRLRLRICDPIQLSDPLPVQFSSVQFSRIILTPWNCLKRKKESFRLLLCVKFKKFSGDTLQFDSPLVHINFENQHLKRADSWQKFLLFLLCVEQKLWCAKIWFAMRTQSHKTKWIF